MSTATIKTSGKVTVKSSAAIVASKEEDAIVEKSLRVADTWNKYPLPRK